jgi:squalene cyclase
MVSLLVSQNPDGGWPYQRGGPSWTEPTAYALLALKARGPVDEPVERGLRWLQAVQRPDGGWPPQPVVRQSVWITAVAALLGPAALGRDAYQRGIRWILEQTGEDTGFFMRARQFLSGQSATDPGWPWFPGTSAWVTPTALSMLALRQAAAYAPAAQIRARLDMGAAYLLGHACSDGGWNHGAARALDYDARSYPETTGTALLALSGRDSPAVRKACAWAQAQLPGCRTAEGESWLRLGLLAHRQLPPHTAPPSRPPRTVQNAALAILAAAAAEGRNPFPE